MATLTVASLRYVEEGVKLSIAHSKTDEEAAGQIVGMIAKRQPRPCPVAARPRLHLAKFAKRLASDKLYRDVSSFSTSDAE